MIDWQCVGAAHQRLKALRVKYDLAMADLIEHKNARSSSCTT